MTDTSTVDAIKREPVAPRSLSEKERRWAEFVRDLQAWELHRLYVVGELELHDDYIEGRSKLMDIFAEICIHGDEQFFIEKTE